MDSIVQECFPPILPDDRANSALFFRLVFASEVMGTEIPMQV